MNKKNNYLKTISLLIIISNINPGINANNFGMRCKRPKAYAFCGSHTVIGTQWFFDSKHSKCLPYKYCSSNREIGIPDDSTENRFEDEMQCQFICKHKKIPPRWKKWNNMDKKRKMDLLGHPKQDKKGPLVVKKLSHYESNDPFRCMKPKSYSFCGSHTIPRIHWYYSKHHRRCLPYNYCENVEDIPLSNNENNFYSEKQCNALCHFH